MIGQRGESTLPPLAEAAPMTNILRDAIADEQSRGPGLLAQIAPERVSEPEAPTTAPEPSESHSGENPARSEANPADDGVCICGDTGVFEGAGCWACDLGTTPCRFCSSHDEPRAVDSKGKVACVDEDACAVRDADPGAPAPSEDENRPCSLCGSTRSERLLVTDGRLGSEDSGIWRCAKPGDCTRRAALRGAREKLSE